MMALIFNEHGGEFIEIMSNLCTKGSTTNHKRPVTFIKG
jgi:hypothetical protein